MSPDRDKELTQLTDEIRGKLAGEPTPAIDPGEHQPIGDGTSCFMNVDRFCGPDCRAFNPESNGETPMSCTILSGLSGLNKNLEALVNITSKLSRQVQDSARTSGPNPPDPRGRTGRTG